MKSETMGGTRGAGKRGRTFCSRVARDLSSLSPCTSCTKLEAFSPTGKNLERQNGMATLLPFFSFQRTLSPQPQVLDTTTLHTRRLQCCRRPRHDISHSPFSHPFPLALRASSFATRIYRVREEYAPQSPLFVPGRVVPGDHRLRRAPHRHHVVDRLTAGRRHRRLESHNSGPIRERKGK